MSRRLVFAVCFIVFGIVVGGMPAIGSASRADVESHCVVWVIDQAPDGELIVSAPECYGSFADSVASATDGEVKLSEGATADTISSNEKTMSAFLAFTIGVHFDGSNGSGDSITVVGDACNGGYWNTGATWMDRISSSWNGCYRLRHHAGPNATGATGDTVGVGATHNVPAAINNKARSVSYMST